MTTVPPESTPVTESLDLVIKLLPHDPFSRYFVTEAQFDLREIKFYTKVFVKMIKIFLIKLTKNKLIFFRS